MFDLLCVCRLLCVAFVCCSFGLFVMEPFVMIGFGLIVMLVSVSVMFAQFVMVVLFVMIVLFVEFTMIVLIVCGLLCGCCSHPLPPVVCFPCCVRYVCYVRLDDV